MTLQSYQHVRNLSMDSTGIHEDLSRMPSFIIEDNHTKWGRLKNKISRIFVKDEQDRGSYQMGYAEPDDSNGNSEDLNCIEQFLERKKIGLDRAKSFKKESGLPKRRKTSLPTCQHQLSQKWTESRHTPSHPPVVAKEAHPLSFICSSQNPLITLPRTMTCTLEQLDQLEPIENETSEDPYEHVNEWIHQSAVARSDASAISSLSDISESSWRPFKSQPSFPIQKHPADHRDAVSCAEYPMDQCSGNRSLESHCTQSNISPNSDLRFSDISRTIVNNSNLSSINTPLISCGSDELFKSYKSLNSFKRCKSIKLSESIQSALPNSADYKLNCDIPDSPEVMDLKIKETEDLQPKQKSSKSRNEFGLLEALKMDVDSDDVDMLDILNEEPNEDSENIEMSFKEALMDKPARMVAKEAGKVFNAEARNAKDDTLTELADLNPDSLDLSVVENKVRNSTDSGCSMDEVPCYPIDIDSGFLGAQDCLFFEDDLVYIIE
eukprot:NODE_118_length_18907_cov_0.436251.p3 type:complete len:493 gc:universal NODE_118_length_18907_cov_0.436251:7924-6446(-)